MLDEGKQATVEDGLLTTHCAGLGPLFAQISQTLHLPRSGQEGEVLGRLKRPSWFHSSSFLNGAIVAGIENRLLLEQMLALATEGPLWQERFVWPKACIPPSRDP